MLSAIRRRLRSPSRSRAGGAGRDATPTADPATPLAGIDDQDLLAEVWRRFGESWCSFSSGVRAPGECPICLTPGPLTRHHLVPRAVGAGRDREIQRRYVKICRGCHELAHATWGPGHRYFGPEEREIFVAELRRVAARISPG